MAAKIEREVGTSPVELISGGRGEFTVWVDEACVASKGPSGFPDEGEVVEAVRRAL